MPETLTERDARRHLGRLIDEQIATRSDAMYLSRHYEINDLGRAAAGIFDKTQMNGLERVALSASTFGEIANYIKSQCGRTTSIGKKWREMDRRSGKPFGQRLYEMLSRKVIGTVASNTKDLMKAVKKGKLHEALRREDEKKRDATDRIEEEVSRQLRVGYAQAYISHVVSHYNYEKSMDM